MKKLGIPYVPELENAGAACIPLILDEKGVRQTIENVNWPSEYPYKPLVSFVAAHSGTRLYIDFTVRCFGLRAVNKANNSDVYQDSCVEFFVKKPGEETYRNFEFNCIGAVHAAVRKDRHHAELFEDGSLDRILRFPSCGGEPLGEKGGLHMWTLTVAIPLDLLGVEYKEGTPVSLTGNFYKCGDATARPHFVSWSPIGTPSPDFHCPQYFGEITLL